MRESEGRKFITDVIWVGLGQLFMSLTGVVVLPALTKNYPPEVYGVWSQMVVTVGLLRIMTIKFESAMIRFLAAEDDRDKRNRAVSTMMLPVIMLSFVVVALSFLLKDQLSFFLFADTQFSNYVPLLMIWASLEALFFFSLSYQRVRSNNKRFSTIRLASAICRMIAIVALAVAGFNFYWIIVSVMAIQTVFVIITFTLIFKELGFFKFSLGGMKKYLVYSLPLIPGELLWWIILASHRYFISHYLSISETGIYSASNNLANLLTLISWPVGMVMFPAISRLWEKGNHDKVKNYFQYAMKFFLILAIPAAIGLYLLSRPLLGILATSEYEAGGGVIVLLLAIGVTFSGVFLINEYTVYMVKKTAWLPVINGAGALINIALNIILIPQIGIMGAAVSTAVSFGVITVTLVLWGRRYINYNMDFPFIFKVIGAAAVMTASVWFINIAGIPGIILVVITGGAVYAAALYFLKVFSLQDKKVIRSAFSGLHIRAKASFEEQ